MGRERLPGERVGKPGRGRIINRLGGANRGSFKCDNCLNLILENSHSPAPQT